tara:strand:+ start:3893 stop:5464 length:1572 start_codon:yes stop_codon:yes gene_type:complete
MPEVCGTGLGNFPVPGDPDMNSGSLTATAKNDGIDVTWTYPTLLAHAVAHTLLYRSTSNSFSTGVEASPIVISGNYYFHQVPLVADTTYYYWIRIVSVNGTVGNLIGPASATMLPSHEFIVDTLVGRIQESQLTALLRSRIDSIDSLNLGLLNEGINRAANESYFSALLNQQINDLAAIDTLVSNEVIERTTSDSALVVQMNAIAATAAGNSALIINEQTARADDNSAFAQDILDLSATFGDTIAAALLVENLVVANNQGALAQSVSTLQVDMGLESGKIQTLQTVVGDVNSGLVAQHSVRIDVNGYVAGYGLLNNGTSSQFVVNAENFAVTTPALATANPNTPADVVFAIGPVNGVQRIVLNAATFIADASIQTLDIAGEAATVPLSLASPAQVSYQNNAVITTVSGLLGGNFGSNIPGKVVCMAGIKIGSSGFGGDFASAVIALRYNTTASTTLAGSTVVEAVNQHGKKGAPPYLFLQKTIPGWSGNRYFFVTLRVTGDPSSASGWWKSDASNITLFGSRR